MEAVWIVERTGVMHHPVVKTHLTKNRALVLAKFTTKNICDNFFFHWAPILGLIAFFQMPEQLYLFPELTVALVASKSSQVGVVFFHMLFNFRHWCREVVATDAEDCFSFLIVKYHVCWNWSYFFVVGTF